MSVNFFTTERLANKFCRTTCVHKSECSPSTNNDGSNDPSGLNVLVVGNIVAEECPILARVWPFSGWLDAANHGGKCGVQQK